MAKKFTAAELRQKALSAKDRTTKELLVPEWDLTLYIRTLSGREREQWESAIADEDGNAKVDGRFRASLVSLCATDEDGERVFEATDVEALSEKAAPVIMRIFETCREVNRLSDAAVETAKNG